MAKKRRGLVVKRTGRMVVIFIFFGTIISTLGYRLIINLRQIGEMKQELVSLEKEKIELLDEEDAINADIKRLSDPIYIARYAREKYLYSKKGELILRIED